MSVLVFIEGSEGELKKSSFELASYAVALSKKMSNSVTAIAIGKFNVGALEKIGNFGIEKVLHANDSKLDAVNVMAYSSVIAEAATKENADVILLPKSAAADAILSRLGFKLKAGIVSGAIDVPDTSAGFKVKKSIYTGKAFTNVELTSAKKVISVAKNAVAATETGGTATVEVYAPTLSDKDFSVTITSTEKATGDILLPEADIVVSGGRGLKGPENWGIIEALAKELGAATGCSKPVSDMDWRPHHEHVGQTGVKVSPNLYIAVGISGAIQHLAGVNSSKCIVVINTDADAPFFKAADYGIVGDAFTVVPKLIEAAKKLK